MRQKGKAAGALLLACLTGCGAVDAGTTEREADRRAPQEARTTADAGADDQTAATPGETVPIRVAGIEIQVEIADDEAERSRGLMYRQSLPANHGMLFVYPDERRLGFWMRNTLIPLDIAYLDRAGRIVDIQQMEPQTSETHYSRAPAMYALEMNQGWFAEHGVAVGALVEF